MSSHKLQDNHREMLRNLGLSDEAIEQRGYESAESKTSLIQCGFRQAQAIMPSVVFPLLDGVGQAVGYQLRPDRPRISRRGEPMEHETTPVRGLVVDVPPLARDRVKNGDCDLFVTNTILKADACASKGMACVAVFGLEMELEGLERTAALRELPLKGRKVFLLDCFAKGAARLEALRSGLAALGAMVRFIEVPFAEDANRQQLSDYLRSGGTSEELVSFASVEAPIGPDDFEPEAPQLLRGRLGTTLHDEPPRGRCSRCSHCSRQLQGAHTVGC